MGKRGWGSGYVVQLGNGLQKSIAKHPMAFYILNNS